MRNPPASLVTENDSCRLCSSRSGVPTLMVFVPSRGGISHSPEEFTAPDALFLGYRFTRELARRLAERGAS